MNPLHASLTQLFGELIEGPPSSAAYMLNAGDPGLLRSLDTLTAEAASRSVVPGGSPIAAHVDHLCYGLDLMNRWSDGEPDPWAGADWGASWKRSSVNGAEWEALRARLRSAARRWHAALSTPRDLTAIELNGVVASIAHVAYHLGAIRQIDRAIQGPREAATAAR